ncbi:hypothetical protein ACLOJK_033456 [Asimina triloba]
MAIAGLYHFTERNEDGSGLPILDTDNGEEIMHIQSSVAVALNNNPPESPGILYISTKRVIWFSDVDRNKGYAVDFLSIALHAVSRDPEAYPSPCIYMQRTKCLPGASYCGAQRMHTTGGALPCPYQGTLISAVIAHCQGKLFLSIALQLFQLSDAAITIETESTEEESEGSDSESNEHLELSKVTEMRLVPADPSQCILSCLDAIFCVFCECAELNPEPVEGENYTVVMRNTKAWLIMFAHFLTSPDQDEENEWIFSAEQMEDDGTAEDSEWHFSENPGNPIGYANGDHDLAQTVLELHINDQRFEDAEETEHGSQGGHHRSNVGNKLQFLQDTIVFGFTNRTIATGTSPDSALYFSY